MIFKNYNNLAIGLSFFICATLLPAKIPCAENARLDGTYIESIFVIDSSYENVVSSFRTAANELFQLDTNISENDYITDNFHYEGREEGILWWASKWKERIQLGLKIKTINNSIRVTLYAEAWERPNAYWDWKAVDSTERAEKIFVAFKKKIKDILNEN